MDSLPLLLVFLGLTSSFLFERGFVRPRSLSCDVLHVISRTRPSRFSTCNIESWEWPGDEATESDSIVNETESHICHGVTALACTHRGAKPSPPFSLATSSYFAQQPDLMPSGYLVSWLEIRSNPPPTRFGKG